MQDEDFDPEFKDKSLLDSRCQDMPRVPGADHFEKLSSVMPAGYEVRRWKPCEVEALRRGVTQQVQQKMFTEELARLSSAAYRDEEREGAQRADGEGGSSLGAP